jgi:hypothetical protein
VNAALYIIGGLAVIAFFVVRQRRSDRFAARSLLFPVILGAYGVLLVKGTLRHDRITFVSVLLLAVSALASVVFGIFRGRTIELSVRDGELWERASWQTIIAGWGGLLLTRACLIALAVAVGATLAASPTWIPLLLAITLAAQILVVGERAKRTGATLAPSRRAWRRARR